MATTVITGGTGGIGAATAAQLLRERADVHVAIVDLSIAEALPGLRDEFSDRVAGFECDVTDPASVHAAMADIAATMPAPDALVNAAGVVSNDPSLDVSLDTLHRVFAVHLDGTLLWSQALARTLDGRPGAIVNVGSVAGQFGHPRRAAYGAAKAAVHHLTKTLAVEWAPLGIRVNAVAAGYIETPLMAEVIRIGLLERAAAADLAAMGRLGTPAEAAAAITFLLQDAASFVTGHVFNVDGGFAVLKAS